MARLPDSGRSGRATVIGGVLIVALAIGWFALSHVVLGTPIVEAIEESFGVAFGLLLLVSVVGAIMTARKNHP